MAEKKYVQPKLHFPCDVIFVFQPKRENSATEGDLSSAICSPVAPALSATSALIEVGVKTGIALLLTLLQQSWATGGGAICNSVLRSTRDVLFALPPLSLANESQINKLGIDSLEQVTEFLLKASLPTGGADGPGTVSTTCSKLCPLVSHAAF